MPDVKPADPRISPVPRHIEVCVPGLPSGLVAAAAAWGLGLMQGGLVGVAVESAVSCCARVDIRDSGMLAACSLVDSHSRQCGLWWQYGDAGAAGGAAAPGRLAHTCVALLAVVAVGEMGATPPSG